MGGRFFHRSCLPKHKLNSYSSLPIQTDHRVLCAVIIWPHIIFSNPKHAISVSGLSSSSNYLVWALKPGIGLGFIYGIDYCHSFGPMRCYQRDCEVLKGVPTYLLINNEIEVFPSGVQCLGPQGLGPLRPKDNPAGGVCGQFWTHQMPVPFPCVGRWDPLWEFFSDLKIRYPVIINNN